jgi:hypothetical protein
LNRNHFKSVCAFFYAPWNRKSKKDTTKSEKTVVEVTAHRHYFERLFHFQSLSDLQEQVKKPDNAKKKGGADCDTSTPPAAMSK